MPLAMRSLERIGQTDMLSRFTLISAKNIALRSVGAQQTRMFADHVRGGSRSWMQREDLQETKYFNEQDRIALEKLMNKLKVHSEPEHQEYHAETLEEIFEHHNVQLSAELKKDLVSWKTGTSN